MIGHKLEVHAVEKLVEAFAAPHQGEGFFLRLAVAALDGSEGATGVADGATLSVLLLDEDCTESNGASVGDDLRRRILVVVRQCGGVSELLT